VETTQSAGTSDAEGTLPAEGTPRASVDRSLISIVKACRLLGVCRRTIYHWLQSGKVEFVRTAGGAVRIYEDTLIRPGHPSEFRSHASSFKKGSRS